MPRILGIGDNTVDLYVDRGEMFPGGNAVNVAVLTHRLGAECGYLGVLGTDAAGRLIRDSLTAEGIDISRCRYFNGANSWSRIRHRGNDRCFDGNDPGPRGLYRLEPDDYAYIGRHDLAHSSVYSLLEEQLGAIGMAVPRFSFDYSDRRDESYLRLTAPHLDIAFLSLPGGSDADCRKMAMFLHGLGPSIAVITRGSLGALAFDGRDVRTQPIVEAKVVDTLGAGDGFIAGFLMAHLAGADMGVALRRGAEAAAEVCGHRGAFGHGIPIPPDQPGAVLSARNPAV